LDRVKSYPLSERASRVGIEDFGSAWRPGRALGRWLESLPKVLAARDFAEIVDRIVQSALSEKTILLGIGAHVIKVGLNPIILDLLNRRLITGVAMNGAGIIHDAEVAMIGRTSEDVEADLGTGRFGMAEETGKFLNAAISEGAKQGLGLGRSVGAMLVQENFPYNRYSLLARAFELEIPVTVHVGIGTDIIHFHPKVDGAAIGQTSHLDFRIFSRLVSTLEKGCFINLGSAVILPEVFLKALSLVRNLGYKTRDITTINLDFIRQYRPMTNVVQRPTLDGGKGYNIVGHHEIMFPLLAAAVLERLIEAQQG
jgi:hypothetical protein